MIKGLIIIRFLIIGAGISGLSIGQLLKNEYEVEVLEKEDSIGGIAKVKNVNGVPYHKVGGHCFNSKNNNVLKFVFNNILPKNEWNLIKRKAKINFFNHFIDYPIEFSIKQIASFNSNLAFNITKDYFTASEKGANNLREWFKEKFGNTLAEKYFIPYNKKIWGIDPKDMSPEWVKGKLPSPNKKEFFQSIISEKTDKMPHANFYYPKSNTQNTFISALSKDLNILTRYKVECIEKTSNKWIVNGEKIYDNIICTIPLKELPFIIRNSPNQIQEHANKLKYNRVTNMLWKTQPNENTWTYYPSEDTIYHRHIHIGNFIIPQQNYTITESIGKRSYEEMKNAGNKINYLIEPLHYNVSNYAYVIFDKNYLTSSKVIKEYLNEIGLLPLGRFGEWRYYNMDVCMASALNLYERIKNT